MHCSSADLFLQVGMVLLDWCCKFRCQLVLSFVCHCNIEHISVFTLLARWLELDGFLFTVTVDVVEFSWQQQCKGYDVQQICLSA